MHRFLDNVWIHIAFSLLGKYSSALTVLFWFFFAIFSYLIMWFAISVCQQSFSSMFWTVVDKVGWLVVFFTLLVSTSCTYSKLCFVLEHHVMHAIKYFLWDETRSVPSNRIHTHLLTCHSLQRNRITVHIPTDALLKMKVCGKECEQSFFSFFLPFSHLLSQSTCMQTHSHCEHALQTNITCTSWNSQIRG